jgi:dihydroneopterin aldolase
MALIELEDMEFYSFHGCYKEEQVAGNKFIIQLAFETNTSKAEQSDNINDTINYAQVYGIVKKEMEVKSHLIEHVGQRIITTVKNKFPQIESIRVKVSKMNPPMGGNMKCVSATIKG